MLRSLAVCFVLLFDTGPGVHFESQEARSKAERAIIDVAASAEWYLERAEKEQTFEGTLRKRESPLGPASRAGLNFGLVRKGAAYPVYSGGADEKLEPFVGRVVRVQAKLIDLTKEGFGKEIWIGTIQPLSDQKAGSSQYGEYECIR